MATYELTKFNFKEDIGKLTEGFVGRQWLFDEIEKWINNKEGQRFFILTGEPGVGKSAIAAQLIKKYKEQYHIAAYHFCTAKESGTIEPNRVLLSLAAQLIDYFPSYAETLINSLKPDLLSVHSEINVKNVKDSVVHGVVFEKLSTRCPQETLDVVLRQPLQKLLKKPGQPFLILIDSLDEAVTRNEENLVALLSKVDDLPSQVRFLYTTRLERRVLSFLENTNAYFYHLAKESEESRNDINQYALKRVDSKEIQEQLRNYQREPEVFVKYLSEPWNGNFLYTKLLLNEIELGLQPLDDLNKLPKDLYGIYHGFLLRIKHEWKRQYRPIVGTLAVTQVPLTQRQISNFTHIKPREIRENLEVLIQFLDVFKENEQADETYTLFHRSFRDYLLDEKRNKDFWCDVKEQHEEIVNYYTAEAKSGYEVDWKKADNYGFLYLPKHLYEAELKQELYELLTSSAKWMEAKFRAFGSDAAYADDLELAIKNFTGLLTSNKLLALVKLYTARQVIHQRVSIYDYNDFTTLVWLGRKEEALSHARLRPDAEDKFKYFITIHNALQEKGEYDPTPLDEAWKVTHQIQTDSKRVRILSRLGVAFAKAKDDKATEVWKEANKVVDTITNKEEKAWALGVLAVALAQAEQFDKAEEVAAKIPDSEYQEMDWSAWAATFAWAGKFDKAKRIADQIQDEKQQAKALSELVTALARGGHIKKAEEIADKFSDPRYQAEALIEIAAALARAGDDKQAAFVKFNEAEKAAATILSDQEWGKVACKLTVALAEAGYPERIKKSVDIIKKDIKDSWEQAETLIELAVAFIPAKNVDVSPIFIKAKEVVDQIQDNSHKAMALSQLAAALAQAGDNKQASEVFSEAGQVSYAIEEDWQQADVMIDVAAVLDRAGRDDVGRVIRKAVEEIAGKIENNWQLQYIQQKLEKARAQAEDAVEVSEVLTSGQVPSMNKDNAEQAEVLEKLATNLDQAGYFTEVKEVACKAIKSGSIRAQTLKELAIALAQAELFSAAEKIADTIEDYSERTETLSELADSLAQSHRWMKAFSVFGLKDRPSLFLAVLVKWKSDFETVEPKLSIAILQEASRIFNWINSDWSQIYKLITSS